MLDWLVYLLAAGAVLLLVRIGISIRRLRHHEHGYDDRLIERLRAQGSDPFKAHEVDFFFALPTDAVASALGARLEAEGYSVRSRPIEESVEFPFSLHATKSMRLSVPDMRELSAHFNRLAAEHGGRYDGWAAGHVPQESATPGR